MFIALQQVISMQIISKITGEPLDSFEVNIQRYPHPPYVMDMAVEALQFLFPMFIMLSFSYTAVNITRAITVEKELQLKVVIKMRYLYSLYYLVFFKFLYNRALAALQEY